MEKGEIEIIKEILETHYIEIQKSREDTNDLIVRTINEQIDKKVNGKIDFIKKEISEIKEDASTRAQAYYEIGKNVRDINVKIDYMSKEDVINMQRVQPVVDFFNNVTWGKKFIIGLAGFLAALGVIIKLLSVYVFPK